MKPKKLLACTLAMALGCVISVNAEEAAVKPELNPSDAEAYEMSQSFQFGCNPRRPAQAASSESVVFMDSKELMGTASFYLEDEGMFLVLESYREDGSMHCAVFAFFGKVPGPGQYNVGKLNKSQLEAEATSDTKSIYAMFVRVDAKRRALFVVESGLVSIHPPAVEGKLKGGFELYGFTIEGEKRSDRVLLEGSFKAVKTEK